MARQSVAIDELYAILSTEFQLVRKKACRTCVAPFPMRRSPQDAVSTNWFVTEAPACPHECRTVIAEIVLRLMSEYELERSVPPDRRR